MGNAAMCVCLSDQKKESLSNINLSELTKEQNETFKNNLNNKILTVESRKIEEKKNNRI